VAPAQFDATAWLHAEGQSYTAYLASIAADSNPEAWAENMRLQIEERYTGAAAANDRPGMLDALACASALTRAVVDHLGDAATMLSSTGMAIDMLKRSKGDTAEMAHALYRWQMDWSRGVVTNTRRAVMDTTTWYVNRMEAQAWRVFAGIDPEPQA
jgi:hypothetical protein